MSFVIRINAKGEKMGFVRLGKISCDRCGYEVTDEWDDLADARKTMSNYGWSVFRKHRRKCDICPNCRLEQKDPILPICKEENLIHYKDYVCLIKSTWVRVVLFWNKEKKLLSEDSLVKTSPRTFRYEDCEWVCHRTESW